ncbi:YdbH domain-containing protein [Shewanella sp. 125m-7]
MQQAVQTTWRRKAARYTLLSLLSLVTLVAIAAMVALWQYQRLTIYFANQFLAPYNTQIHQLNYKLSSLTQWHVSNAKLTVDDSDIEITGIDLQFDKNTKPWAFKVSDLQALSVDKVEVQLAPSALTISSQNNNEAGPTIGLTFDGFPNIDLKQIHIILKGADASAPSFELNNLSLNKLGELKSQIKIDNNQLLSLTAKLTPKQWDAKTNIDLTLLQSFSRRLAATEQTLAANQAKSKAHAQSHGHNVSLLAPLYRLTQALEAKNISFDATLDSTLKLDLKTAMLTSEHSLHGTKLVLNNFANFTLQPISLGQNIVTKQEAQKQLGTLNFDINGHIATPTLVVKPFELPLNLAENDSQFERLLHQLNDKPFENALRELYQELSLNTQNKHKRPSLLLKLENGLRYHIGQQVQASPQILVPKLSLTLKNSKLDASILVSSLSYQTPVTPSPATTNNYQINADWQLEAQHTQTVTLNKLWPTLSTLPYLIEIDKAALNLQGELAIKEFEQQTRYNIKVASNGTQMTNGLRIRSHELKTAVLSMTDAHTLALNTLALNTVSGEPAAPQLNALIAQTKLSTHSAIEYHYHSGATELTLPRFSYQVTGIEGDLQLNNALDDRYLLQLNNVNLVLEQPMLVNLSSNNLSSDNLSSNNLSSNNLSSNNFGSDNASVSNSSGDGDNNRAQNQSFFAELLTQQLSNKISLSLAKLSLDKSSYSPAEHTKSRQHNKRLNKQKLALLDSVELTQKLSLKRQQINSDESWQVNDLTLTSQHQFTPNLHDLSRFNLTGNWQFSSKFAPIIAFLSQTDSLPKSLDIQGNTELAMHYKLSREQQVAFDLSLVPRVSNIQGTLYDLPFEGGNIDTLCQFSWQQDSAKMRASAFNCDNIKLSLQAFNPGILITDINAEAAVSFSTESTLESLTPAQDSKQNLALAQQLFGIKQASVGLTAKGDLLGGQLLIPQFQLNLKKPSSAYFVLQHIDLKKVLAIHPMVGISADGIFDGVLPVSIEKGKASVSGGRLAARAPGGVIAIGDNPAVDKMRQREPYLEFAFSALEHLNYSELSSTFDMNALGDAILKVHVKGHSRGVERPIHFNYSQEENMLQLLRSLQIGDNLQNQIERAIK